MEELSKFAEPGDMEQLQALQQQVEDYIREQAEQQGLEGDGTGKFRLTPKALRLFQSKVLTRDLRRAAGVAHRPAPGRGRRRGRGRVAARPSPTSSATRSRRWTSRRASSTPCSATGPGLPVRMKPDDIVIHRDARNAQGRDVRAARHVRSMRYDGQYVNVKRMGLALDGLIRTRVPGRLPPVHRDVHVRQAAARLRGRRTSCPSR